MIQLNRSMMERYEIADHRPESARAVIFGTNHLMLGVVARLLDDAGIGAVCVTEAAEALRAQDGMFTLLVRGEKEDGAPIREERVVQSILEAVGDDEASISAAAANPELTMLFLTVSGGFGSLVGTMRFLHARWQAKLPAPVVIKVTEGHAADCANDLREVLCAFNQLWKLPEEFIGWLKAQVAFRSMLAESLCGGLNEKETARAQHEMNYKDAFIGWAEPQPVCTLNGEAPAELKGVLAQQDFALACEKKTRVFDALVFLCAPAGFLMGKHSFAEVMADEALRAWIGAAFFEEVLPALPWSREEITPYVISSFNRLQNSANELPLLDLGRHMMKDFPRTLLPAIRAWADREFEAPPKVSLAFAAAIILYAGARLKNAFGYVVLRGDEELELRDNSDILRTFSQLAHDVPAETLAYAVLADRALWGEDLREIDGLEQRIAMDLSAIQRIGFKEALKLCMG